MNYLCNANEKGLFLIKQVMENINFKKVSQVIDELKGNEYFMSKFGKWGKNNPKPSEKQLLYGDVGDWLRDNKETYPLNLAERSFVTIFLIGEYVTKEGLL